MLLFGVREVVEGGSREILTFDLSIYWMFKVLATL